MLRSCVHTTRVMNTNRLWAGHLKSFCRKAGMQLSSRGQGLTHHIIPSLYLLPTFLFAYQLFSHPGLVFFHMVRNVVTKAPVFLASQFLSSQSKIVFFPVLVRRKVQGKSSDWSVLCQIPISGPMNYDWGGMESCGNMVAT